MDKHEIIVVDHAGELGAVEIYQGQIDAARLRGEDVAELEAMREHEQRHLEYFEMLMRQGNIKQTPLIPLWRFAGRALGFVRGMMGKEARSQVTHSVETVIDGHYREQIEWAKSNGEDNLAAFMEDFRRDEDEHKQAAERDLTDSGCMRVLGKTVELGSVAAIEITKKAKN
jgi:Ubiquinone biosynthesis protein COQ7